MHLNIDDSKGVDQPTSAVIRTAINELDSGQFVILASDQEEVYVQAMLEENGAWILEYRAGSAEQHFGTDPDSTTSADVISVFEAFLAGGSLEKMQNWEQVDLSPNQLEEGEVEYNGVIMNAGWPEQIEAAQLISQFDFAGTMFDRVAFGTETDNATQVLPNCGDCGVLHGQFHVPGCEIEQCPKCDGTLAFCECEYDYQG